MATALNEHIVTSYEDELINLNKAISEMGGMVESQVPPGGQCGVQYIQQSGSAQPVSPSPSPSKPLGQYSASPSP